MASGSRARVLSARVVSAACSALAWSALACSVLGCSRGSYALGACSPAVAWSVWVPAVLRRCAPGSRTRGAMPYVRYTRACRKLLQGGPRGSAKPSGALRPRSVRFRCSSIYRRPLSREGSPHHPRALVWPLHRRGRLPRGGLGRSAPLSRPIFVRVARFGRCSNTFYIASYFISKREPRKRGCVGSRGARVPPRVSRRRDTVGCPAAHELAYRPCLGAYLARDFGPGRWLAPFAGMAFGYIAYDWITTTYAPFSPQARDRQVAAQLPHAAPLQTIAGRASA